MLRQARSRSFVAVFPTLEARLAAIRRAAHGGEASTLSTGCAECGGDDATDAEAEAPGAGEACGKEEPTATDDEDCGCDADA